MISGGQVLLLAVMGMLIAAGCVTNPSAANASKVTSAPSQGIPLQTPTLPELYSAQPVGLPKPAAANFSVPGVIPTPVPLSGYGSTETLSDISNSSTSSVHRVQAAILPASTIAEVIPAATPSPVSSFTADPVTGDAPLGVHFRDTSNFGATSWSWDFGDGTHSYLQHPDHTYPAPGNYSVRMSAASGAYYSGCPCCVASGSITVYPAGRPQPHLFAYPTEGISPLWVRFNDTSDYPLLELPTDWYWDFDDGTTSVLQNPVHPFYYGRPYNVTFRVTNPRGSREMNQIINVYPPVTRFAPNKTPGYAPLPVKFTDISVNSALLPTDYLWDFGDGTSSWVREPEHTFADGRCYNVSFTVSSRAGTSSYSDTISVYRPDFSVEPGYGGNPLAVLFRDTGYGCPSAAPTAWFWDFGDGYSIEKRSTVHQYVAPGTYTVGFRVTGPAGETWVYKTAVVTVT